MSGQPHPHPSEAASNAAEISHVIKDIDYLFNPIDFERIEELSFHINDIPFQVSRKKDPDTGGTRVCIQAVLGYLPYSAESEEKRQAIFTILASTPSLFNARFGLDRHGRVFVAGIYYTDTLTSPDFLFYPLTLFLQEAQPFIALIGQYL